jgi:integrase
MKGIQVSEAKKVKFCRVAPSVYRYFEILSNGKKGKGTGSYYAYYWRGGYQIKISLDTEDIKEASFKMRKVRAEQDRLNPDLRGLTLGTACDKFLAGRQNLSPSQKRLDTEAVRRIKETFIGGTLQPLRMIKPSDCERFVAELRKLDKRRLPTDEPPSVSLRNQIVSALKGIFELAVLDGAINTNPVRLKQERRPEPKRLTPTWDEFLQIIERVRNEALDHLAFDSADWLEFSGRAGLGSAEINKLTWQDIDFEKGQMWVYRKKTKTNYLYTLHALVIPFLKGLKAKKKPAPTDRLFKVRTPREAFYSACRALKLQAFDLRSLRRVHMSLCMMSKIPAFVVAQNQGHRDGGILVQKTYNSIQPQFVVSEFAKLKEPKR